MNKVAEENIDFQKLIKHEKQINKQIISIGITISLLTKFAWVLIAFGAATGLFVLIDKIALKSFLEFSMLFGLFALSTWILAGLFFVYISFLGQKQHIMSTQIETKFNEIELKTTSIEHEVLKHRFNQLHDSIKQERFESTFFQLLSVHNVIVNSLDIIKISDNESIIAKGRDCFSTLYQQFLQKIRFVYDSNLEKILGHYDEFYSENQADLGHYFGNLYHIVKFVDTSDIDDKAKYINFIRAQLSSYELGLMFYHGLSKQGTESFRPLIERYSLLKNIPKTLIIDASHFRNYNPTAY